MIEQRGLARNAMNALAILFILSVALGARAQPVPEGTQVLRVATREVPPFAMRDEQGEWSGISILLVEELRKELAEARGQAFTLDLREMGLQEMLTAVERGEVDLAAAALTVNFEREKRVDFSHPYYSSGLGIAVSRDDSLGLLGLVQSVLSPTFLRIVAGLLTTMLVTAVAVHLFERRVNREQFGGGVIRGVAAGVWWAAVTLTTVGYGDKVPKSAPGRLIGLVWMFSGLFIIASFTAAVTSALTVNQLRSRVSGPADLARLRVASVQDSTSASYLRSRRIYFRPHEDVGAALASLSEGRCDAVVYDSAVLRYEVHRRFPEDLHVLPPVFERQEYAFALASDSPLREAVNQALLRMTSTPAWDDQVNQLLGHPPSE